MGTEISRVLATGTNWVMVPQTARLTLRGTLQPGVLARDVGFAAAKLLREAGERGVDIDYRVLEYAGDLDQFSLAARASLCSSPTEMRAYGVFVPPSPAVLEHARSVAKRPFTAVFPDPDALYEHELELDIGALEPQVATPGGVHNAVDVAAVAGTPVSHAFVGSCGSSMWDDMVIAASLLQGERLAPGVRMYVVPGSDATLQRLAREGLMQIFLEAGALVLPAGCGPCNDAVIGPVHSGEASISTAAANQAGRLGAKDAQLYLGNPATVAASAVAGCITDPRTAAAWDRNRALRESLA
jgi:3-isopropylmalate/(R)-2-methylmalate dehydratase large subunit